MSKRPTPKQKRARGRSTRQYAAYTYKAKRKIEEDVAAARYVENVRARKEKEGVNLKGKSTGEDKITKIAA